MGVYSRTNKDGSISWVIQYFLNGKRKREAVSVKTRKQAELALAKRKVEIEESRLWGRKTETKLKFKEWAEEYIRLKEKQGRKSLYSIKIHINRLNEHFGSQYLSDINPAMIESYFAKRRKDPARAEKPLSPASINRELAQLKNLFTEAQRNGFMDKNPAQFVRFLKENNERKRVLAPEELERLLCNSPQYLREIILFAYYTGMRKGEILNLTWDRVNFKEKIIQLKPEDTKTSEGREVPLNNILSLLLQEKSKVRQLHCNHVFTYQGKPLEDFKKAFKTACQNAEIEDFRFHDLRHTFVTYARKAGIHDFVIMGITGHKTQSMFRRYNTVDREDLIKASSLLPQLPPLNSPTGATRKKNGPQGAAQVLDFTMELIGIEPTTS